MIHTLVYRDAKLVRQNVEVAELATLRADPTVMLWVDLAEANDDEIKKVLQETFQVHQLTIDDCLHDSPLPKFESYESYVYIVVHAVDYTRSEKFTTTELDLILGTNFLISFHKRPLKAVQIARDRFVRNSATLVRGPDRIAHTLLDAIVENFKPALDTLRHEIESIEEAVLTRSRDPLAQRIIDVREDLTKLRQILRPQRELAVALSSGQSAFFRPKLLPYLRDVSDSLVRLEEQVQSWSEQLIFTFKLFLNRSSHEANEGIRVLTGLTAVAIPLLLIGSWFSMNFEHMPMLDSARSYWGTTVAMVVLSGVMFVYLKKRKWF